MVGRDRGTPGLAAPARLRRESRFPAAPRRERRRPSGRGRCKEKNQTEPNGDARDFQTISG
jgi:hypothetical protein